MPELAVFIVLKVFAVAALFFALTHVFTGDVRRWSRCRRMVYFGTSFCTWIIVFASIAWLQ